MVLFLAMSLSVIQTGWIIALHLLTFVFRYSSFSNEELLKFTHIALFLVGINIVTLLFGSLTAGLQRLDITNTLSGLNTVVAAMLTFFFVVHSFGVEGVLWANLLSAGGTLILYGILTKKLLPSLRVEFRNLDRQEFTSLFGFSLRL